MQRAQLQYPLHTHPPLCANALGIKSSLCSSCNHILGKPLSTWRHYIFTHAQNVHALHCAHLCGIFFKVPAVYFTLESQWNRSETRVTQLTGNHFKIEMGLQKSKQSLVLLAQRLFIVSMTAGGQSHRLSWFVQILSLLFCAPAALDKNNHIPFHFFCFSEK